MLLTLFNLLVVQLYDKSVTELHGAMGHDPQNNTSNQKTCPINVTVSNAYSSKPQKIIDLKKITIVQLGV